MRFPLAFEFDALYNYEYNESTDLFICIVQYLVWIESKSNTRDKRRLPGECAIHDRQRLLGDRRRQQVQKYDNSKHGKDE
jgi:hypothetical protein